MATQLRVDPAVPAADLNIRHDWTRAEAEALFALPLNDLLFKAQGLLRQYFDPNEVQLSTLLNVKTGGCPEDCRYCAQSSRYDTGLKAEKLMELDEVLAAAKAAKDAGAGRFCMGAAWRSPKERDLDRIVPMIEGVKALGLETCVTLGMLEPGQASRLKDAGLDYYNHNLDTSEEYYPQIVTTRTYGDRLDTLANVRDAGIKVCCGGIIGMGEGEHDRASMLVTLANLPQHPDSVPINALVQIEGTPLALEGNAKRDKIDPFDFVRTIAVARVMMPASMVRIAAGRLEMDEATQALCLFAGANSIFYGDKLLTTPNPDDNQDEALLDKLGYRPMASSCDNGSCGA
ncbi:MAG TPA: biotin synthase BioB [Alphaproteobacteria bacterium]|jgi:biotin synthase